MNDDNDLFPGKIFYRSHRIDLRNLPAGATMYDAMAELVKLKYADGVIPDHTPEKFFHRGPIWYLQCIEDLPHA